MSKIILQIPHPSLYMLDVINKAIDTEQYKINLTKDELEYLRDCIEKCNKETEAN